MKETLDYSYFEPSEALGIRIDAHKKYSKFSLEKYLETNFNVKNKNILDIGCGNGNFSGFLSNNANLYIGVEKNRQSIEEAFNIHRNNKNIIFVNQDMDNDFLFPDELFDYIFFIFSAYYTNDPEVLFNRCKRMLGKGGKVVIIGPTVNNAREVDDFCYEMFSKEKPSSLRAKRIESEFTGVLDNLKFDTQINKINFNLEFPDYNSYMDYLKATLQYRDSFTSDFKIEKSRHLIEKVFNLTLTKEVVSLCAEKK